MIKQSGINFRSIPEEQPDHILGAYTGAGNDLRCHRRSDGSGSANGPTS